jgi:hypothetical protein
MARNAYRPHEGNVWNPLLGYPRNDECFCRSGKKAKKCCLPNVHEVVTEQQALDIKRTLARGGKIILTDSEDDPNKNDVEVQV